MDSSIHLDLINTVRNNSLPGTAALTWYKKLDAMQRINLKLLCVDICGVAFTDLVRLFTLRECISILHEKLELEGFAVWSI